MAEHAITYEDFMVRALLRGKTQDRRLGVLRWKPGDLLWVREAWQKCKEGIAYRATDETPKWRNGYPSTKWRSPVHMPHDASRFTLEITDIRKELVQDITEADAIAEGFDVRTCEGVLDAASKREKISYPHWLETKDGDTAERSLNGDLCESCALKELEKHPELELHSGSNMESDGPAYCDECGMALFMELTDEGINCQLHLEKSGWSPEEAVARFPCDPRDAKIAAMIAGEGDFLDPRFKGRLAQITFSTHWDRKYAKRGLGWAANPRVSVITFQAEERKGRYEVPARSRHV